MKWSGILVFLFLCDLLLHFLSKDVFTPLFVYSGLKHGFRITKNFSLLFSLFSFYTHKKKPFMRASLMLIRPDEFVAWKRKHKELIVVFGSCGDESVGFTIRKKNALRVLLTSSVAYSLYCCNRLYAPCYKTKGSPGRTKAVHLLFHPYIYHTSIHSSVYPSKTLYCERC